MPRAAVTVGLAAFLGMAGAGVAFAVTGNGSSPSTATPGSQSTTPTSRPGSSMPGPGPGAGRAGGPGGAERFGLGGPGGPLVHGVFTVRNGSSYKTLEEQSGTVTGVSSSSITVKSADGYSQTYAVQPSTVVDSQAGGISTVAQNDKVRVEGLQQSAGSFTATNIVDVTKVGSSRQGFGVAPPNAPPQGPGGANPSE